MMELCKAPMLVDLGSDFGAGFSWFSFQDVTGAEN
jgi:hypothetical protein